MEDILSNEYGIIYSEVAKRDIQEKADYICFQLKSPRIAYSWYNRIRKEIHENLATFPSKYREFDASGRRIFISRTDIVLYRVDEENRAVIIESVCTRGKDLEAL